MILVRMLWNKLFFRSKLWYRLSGCIAIIVLVGCKQDHEEFELVGKQQSIQVNIVSPDTILLADLPDSLRPKPIWLENKPTPLKIKIPKTGSSGRAEFHPIFKKARLKPPVEVEAEFSTIFQNYSTEEGVAVDLISCSFADSKGNLWFGTFVAGLSKYNGKDFTKYTTAQGLISNEISNITEDNQGNIWIATDKGVSKFDGAGFTTVYNQSKVTHILQDRDETFWFSTYKGLVHHTTNGNTLYTKNNGLSSNRLHTVVQNEQGELFIANENGISIYDGQKFTHKTDEIDPKYRPIRQIIIDNNQNIWIGSPFGLAKVTKEKISYYPVNKKFNKYSKTYTFLDSKDNIWLVIRGEEILRFDGSNFTSINPSRETENNEIENIVEDASGNIWMGTNAGIIKYAGDAILNIKREQGIIDRSIRSIVQDDEGNLWFAGNSEGISRFDGVHFLNFSIRQGLPTQIFWAIETDRKGNIWLGTTNIGYGGLIKFDKESFTILSKNQGLASPQVYFIYHDQNDSLYIATSAGISIFDGKSFTNFSDRNGLVNKHVFCITKAKNGDFWFGTAGGISKFNGQSFVNYSGENVPDDVDIKSIVEDKEGNLWLGTYGKGLYRFDGDSFHQFTMQDGLTDDVITQVALSEESDIVIGTNNGIAILKGFDQKRKLSDFQKNSESLHVNVNNKISNSELSKYVPKFEIYNTSTGYQIKDVNRGQRGIYLDKKGMLWIATGSEKSGLVRMDYKELSKNKGAPKNTLTAIKINNENISWRSLTLDKDKQENTIDSSYTVDASISEEISTYGKPLSSEERLELRSKFKDLAFDTVSPFNSIPQNLVLPHSQNNLTVEFCAIEPADPKLVNYQFKLEGYSDSWSPPSNQTSATFGNIFEGDYTFYVRSQITGGVWSEPLTYSFTVLPPWYRTLRAYISYILIFLVGFRSFSKYRERKLIAEKEKLEETVLERTNELILEKKKSDNLLLNILPKEIAQELKETGSVIPKRHKNVTILMTDFKGFTELVASIPAITLVDELNDIFGRFDEIVEETGIQKIETIGDAYVAAYGLEEETAEHAINCIIAAQKMLSYLEKRNKDHKLKWNMRVGIHSGPIVAGVVGKKKFNYDLFGDTINTASRMESSGEPGRINISDSTYQLVKHAVKCECRGKIHAKGKGELDMYFVK
ncbi:adenylate/guanylate cyclase domain-containing protein [Winogradskyella sp. PG-2]|uniref:adenylate/guanylate cyclase domain-containing protein n=1 Tax=Winogradskyella sp. PG-2 TaxID=754409 RepID=UPI00045865E3|nr:adenylate/guanylate cyclase domain-containing protein [Winogradskyella sp. PG-2]BAO76567.1 adenylate cyclase [Winogradskyella sp. PG-2]